LAIFERYYSEEFARNLQKYRALARRIERKIDLLVRDPYRNCRSELLVGNLKGLRCARLTKSIRIIFAICEECRKRGWQELNGCSETLCRQLPSRTVIFFTVDVHEKAYDR